MSLGSDVDAASTLSETPLYYQGRFISGASTSSDADGDVFGGASRPGGYGTIAAADVGSRGDSFQLSGGGSNGAFNLPRYYPKYKSFRGVADPVMGGPRQDGQRRPYNGEDSLDEPVYAKPRKNKSARDRYANRQQQQQKQQQYGDGTREDNNQTFTVVDGFDAESLNEGQEDKRRRRKKIISLIIVLAVLLAMGIVAVVAFLAVYLTTPNSLSTTNAPQVQVQTLFLDTVLRINASFDSSYSALNNTKTSNLTLRICDALKETLMSVNLPTGVATWANNCSAVNYSKGSIVATHRIAMNVTSSTAAGDVISSVNATLTNATSASHRSIGTFYQLFNTTVDLNAVTSVPYPPSANTVTSWISTPAATTATSISVTTSSAVMATVNINTTTNSTNSTTYSTAGTMVSTASTISSFMITGAADNMTSLQNNSTNSTVATNGTDQSSPTAESTSLSTTTSAQSNNFSTSSYSTNVAKVTSQNVTGTTMTAPSAAATTTATSTIVTSSYRSTSTLASTQKDLTSSATTVTTVVTSTISVGNFTTISNSTALG